jgi:hypothetical protein
MWPISTSPAQAENLISFATAVALAICFRIFGMPLGFAFATASFQISCDLCKKDSHRSPFMGSIHAKSSCQVIPWTVLFESILLIRDIFLATLWSKLLALLKLR